MWVGCQQATAILLSLLNTRVLGVVPSTVYVESGDFNLEQMLFHAELSLQPVCINFMVYSSSYCNVLLPRFGSSFSSVSASVVGSIFFSFSLKIFSPCGRGSSCLC